MRLAIAEQHLSLVSVHTPQMHAGIPCTKPDLRIDRQPKKALEQHLYDAAMSDYGDALSWFSRPPQPRPEGLDACAESDAGFTRWRGLMVFPTALRPGVALLRLLEGQTCVDPIAEFPQVVIQGDGYRDMSGNEFGGLSSAPQRTRNDEVRRDAGSDPLGRLLSLPAAEIGERKIGLCLVAALDVRHSLSMPHDEQLKHDRILPALGVAESTYL